MAVTRYSDGGISPRTNVYAAKKMLESADPVIVLDMAADIKPMPKNKTQTVKFRRPQTLDAVTTPLVEGVTPDVTPFRFEDVEGTLQQYGQVLGITDQIADTHEDPVLMEMSGAGREEHGPHLRGAPLGRAPGRAPMSTTPAR